MYCGDNGGNDDDDDDDDVLFHVLKSDLLVFLCGPLSGVNGPLSGVNGLLSGVNGPLSGVNGPVWSEWSLFYLLYWNSTDCKQVRFYLSRTQITVVCPQDMSRHC